MKNKPMKSWRDVSINEFYEIKDISEDETLTEYDKTVSLTAYVNQMDEQDVWNLPITKFKQLQKEREWMQEFKFDTKKSFKKITINNNKYTVDVNLQHFNVAQYIDFQTYWPMRDNMRDVIGNILAIFIIPKGHSYNEGYDIAEVIDDIKSSIDIMTANEILFFFLSSYQTLMKVSVSYLKWMTKRKFKKDKLKTKQLEEQIQNLEKLISDGLLW